MSKTKAGGTTKNNRDSAGKRLGVKVFAGESVKSGAILVRQIGRTKLPGDGTMMARDYTIFAVKEGVVEFNQKRIMRFTGKTTPRTEVKVV